MFKGFREFVLRGNVIDLAVGVVIGAAFGAVVTSLTKDILTPLIAAIVGKPDFSALVLTVNGANITYGLFLNALISFLLVAAAVYYFVITPVNALVARAKRGEIPPDPTTKNCPQCLMEIPVNARKCGHCASVLA
jgi:large conductance mechanosensitive channel